MDIMHLIDRLEELFNASRAVPLTHTVLVDEDRMLDIIDQMRIAIPEEVKKAQQLLAQRDRVLAQSQEEANRTLTLARDKADQMAQKDSISHEAQRRAEQIVSQARADAEATRHEADNYIVDALTHLKTEMERLLNQVNNGIHTIEKERKQMPPSEPTPGG